MLPIEGSMQARADGLCSIWVLQISSRGDVLTWFLAAWPAQNRGSQSRPHSLTPWTSRYTLPPILSFFVLTSLSLFSQLQNVKLERKLSPFTQLAQESKNWAIC